MTSGRISFPTIPRIKDPGPLPAHCRPSLEEGARQLADFLMNGNGNTVILTGAGVSVDSGVKAYRGADGLYTSKKPYRPIFYHEFMSSELFRRRYFARSYLGYPPVKLAKPNPTHFTLAALQQLGHWRELITQNVDGLHHQVPPVNSLRNDILELHGSLRHVHCTECGADYDRDSIQDELSRKNPQWEEFAREIATTGKEPRTNPDGDVELQNKSYESFNLVDCSSCGGILKPSVVFFGENLSKQVKDQSLEMIDSACQILIIGSSLATFSAYRLAGLAKSTKKPIGIINLGPSRADNLEPDLRLDLPSSQLLYSATKLLLKESSTLLTKQEHDQILTTMDSGVIKVPDSEHRTE